MKRKLRKLKQNEQGTAMIAVLCILAVFVALALALLLAASTLMHTAGREISGSRVKIEAVTFSDEAEEELTDRDGSLYRYVQEQISTGAWLPGEEAAKEFTGESGCELSLVLYWERPEGLPQVEWNGTRLFLTATCTRDGMSHRITSEFELSCREAADGSEEAWEWKRLRRS